MTHPQISTAPPPLAARLRDVASSPVREILALTQQPGVISFAGGLPAPELFDAAGLRAAFAAALADEAYGRTLQYSTTEGDPALRAAIAAADDARAAWPTEADEILVTSGSQQALTLIAAVLLEPGDAVLVEEPSYLAALQCFQMAGARVVPVPCDDDGLDPEALAALVRRERPKLLYTVPTFHNPTGRTLPLERRAALAQAAARLGLWIVEDDPYGELRYRGEPIAPIASLPTARRTGRSRCRRCRRSLVPGLRIGWLRAPAALRRALVVAKQAADLHTSTIDQAAAAHWLASVRPRRARRRPACRLRPAPRRARRRPARDAARRLALDAARRRHVRLGPRCPTAGTPTRCWPTRWPARSRSSPAGRSSPVRRTARRCASRSRPTRWPRSPKASAACAPPWTAAGRPVTLHGRWINWRASLRPTRTWGARCRYRGCVLPLPRWVEVCAVGPARHRGLLEPRRLARRPARAASPCTPGPTRRLPTS